LGQKDCKDSKELRYLTDYYPVTDKSPQRFIITITSANLSTRSKLKSEIKPDVVGISSLFTPYYREALEVAARVKKHLNIPVVMGGSHASAVPESLLSSSHVDYVINGEGEKPLVEFLQYLKGGKRIENVPNLIYKREGKLVSNPTSENFSMDELPFPDLRDFTPGNYRFAGKPMTFMDRRGAACTNALSARCTRLSARTTAAVRSTTCSKKSICAISRAFASSTLKTII
jgi:radical SAM superfamily enzyme YgiQ (UPF0313 family)